MNWTPASRAAGLAAGAIACLLIGMLLGEVATSGERPQILQALTHPAGPRMRRTRPSGTGNGSTVRRPAVTTTVTSTETRAASAPVTNTVTMTEPPTTVTVTETTTTSPTTDTTGP